MVFIDSNIPMYLVGADHPHKKDTVLLLDQLADEKRKFVANAEVIQEILHRYTSLQRTDAIQPALDMLYKIVSQIFDVTEKDALGAKDLIMQYKGLQSRDAIHAAQMKRLEIKEIISFDKGFDRLPFIKRLS